MPSRLPLSFLCQNAKRNQAAEPGVKFAVSGYGETHDYYRSETGRVTFVRNDMLKSEDRITDGWQFFISVLPEDRDKAWPLITPFLLTKDSPVLAFAVDDSDTRGVIPEEAFMLYTFKSRFGILLQSPEAMHKLCKQLEDVLLVAKIRTGDGVSNTTKLSESRYISMKYIDKNKKQAVNPYQSLISTPQEGRFFSALPLVAIDNDVFLLGDDESVVSDLTC